MEILTDRLMLRDWRESDLAPWAAMNADPAVREYLGPVLTPEQSAASAAQFQLDMDRNGFGFWAVEVRATGEFVGFTGLDVVDEGVPYDGVEAGWRLARAAWGHGYAGEAATAVFTAGFTTFERPEILAITATGNERSQAVMRRLGMTHDPADDFDDPTIDDPALCRQVVYRRFRDDWPYS